MRARLNWKFHITLTLLTLGLWGVCFLSFIIKRAVWPWRCEHCAWHEPDFRSPEERTKGLKSPRPRAGESGSWVRTKEGKLVRRDELPIVPDPRPTDPPRSS